VIAWNWNRVNRVGICFIQRTEARLAYTTTGLCGRNLLPLSDLSDIVSFRDEWQVLLEFASPVPNTSRLAGLARSVDWSRILVLAEEQGVLGHVAKRLHELDGNLVPAEVRKALLERHRAQVFATLRMTGELFRLLELFAAQDILALVVKGPVLAMQAYADPTIRSYSDLDLLVRQPDIRRATESLLVAGYQAAVPLSAIDAGRIPGQYLFAKSDTNLLVELHNELTLRYFPRRLPLEKLFAQRTVVRLDHHEVPVLAVEDELVYICVHGATHLWDRLNWIADVAALVTHQSDIDWMAVRGTAKEVGVERMLHTGLHLAADLLRAPLPDRVLVAVKRDVGSAKLAACASKWLPTAREVPPTLFERAVFRLRMRGNAFAAPAYLLRLSFSPTEEDWQAIGTINHRRVFEMLRRPFRLAQKYSRGSKP
jgi:hypothetical protein